MPDPLDKAPGRLVGLIVATIAGVTAIGFMTGISSTEYDAERPPVRERPAAGDVPPARTHAELERNPWSNSGGWPTAAAAAEARATGADDTATPEAAETAPSVGEALAERAAMRAYDGAPPMIPHPVRSSGAAECLACHEAGFTLGNRTAARLPHADFASCTQCHVTLVGPFVATAGNAAASAASSWAGLAAPTGGGIAYKGAPPAVPHPTLMRDRCDSCHGENGRAALQTPHPERQSCLQCHPATGGRVARASR